MTLEEKFLKFHEENPHIYRGLIKLARQAKARGKRKLGIAFLFEVMRWHQLIHTNDPEFKMNNNNKAFYARMIMAQEPDLKDFFEIRSQGKER